MRSFAIAEQESSPLWRHTNIIQNMQRLFQSSASILIFPSLPLQYVQSTVFRTSHKSRRNKIARAVADEFWTANINTEHEDWGFQMTWG